MTKYVVRDCPRCRRSYEVPWLSDNLPCHGTCYSPWSTVAATSANPFDRMDIGSWRKQMEEVLDKLAENARNEPYAQRIRQAGGDPESHVLVLPAAMKAQGPRHLSYVKYSEHVTEPYVVRRLW